MNIREQVKTVLAEVHSYLEPLRIRVRLMLGKGVLHLVNDVGRCQTVQAAFLVGETRDSMERPQDYGFTSHPLAGMQPFAGFFGGDRSNGFVICVCDRQYRIELLAGEVAMYDDLGQKVHLTRTGAVVETPLNVTVKAGQDVRIEGRNVAIHATDSFRFDVHGHGEHWFPDRVDPWTIDAVAGAPHPISPPEIA